jgi:restriction endonuclease Mrr
MLCQVVVTRLSCRIVIELSEACRNVISVSAVGVQTVQTVDLYRLDEDFFDEL